MLTLDLVTEQAMALPESERARLATDLLMSLPPISEEDDDEYEEALRREAEMDADPSMEITLEQLAAALGR